MIAVAWLSLAPQDIVPGVDIWDKLAHFLAYAVLALCGGFAFSVHRIGVTVGGSLIDYGSILEISQIFIPGRSGSIADAIADGLGVLAGMVIARNLRGRFTN